MDTGTADASSKTTGGHTATMAKADDAKSGKTSSVADDATSEDFVIFGARPSHVFDDIAIAVDSLLVEEVASLPLLPRAPTESDRRQAEAARGKENENENGEPQTGEEKLLGKLRDAYRRNLDLAEAYCSRNVFTVRYHSKTMRRKIMENYLAQDDEDGDKNKNKNNEDDEPAMPVPLPATTFPPPDGELPTPDQITGMDEEILRSRRRLREAKRRRARLRRQSERLADASRTLAGVREALEERGSGGGDDGGAGGAEWIQKLREAVTGALEGHEELGAWNSRAEEALRRLDAIKAERDEANGPTGKASGSGEKKVVGREQDERERKRMREDFGGCSGSHIPSLLKKLRGK